MSTNPQVPRTAPSATTVGSTPAAPASSSFSFSSPANLPSTSSTATSTNHPPNTSLSASASATVVLSSIDSLPSSSSLSVTNSTPLTTTGIGPRRAFTRYPNRQGPTIHIPQPLSPIGLHHVLDLSTASSSSTGSALESSRQSHTYPSPCATHILSRQYHQPRPLHAQQPVEITPQHQAVIDTLAQPTPASTASAIAVSAPPSSSTAQHARRIMTPTSRLAETAVSVREVSKKIGRARVKWETPKTVMIVTKPGDDTLLKTTRQIALWMIVNRGLMVYVDEKLKDQPKFRYPKFLKDASTESTDYTQHLGFWNADLCAQEAHLFDFAITLGGDGTVLFTSWLFQRIVPPILPFSAGSLGFLTPFPTTDYQRIIGNSLDQGVRVSLRMRFSCTIYRCLEHRAAEKEKKSKKSKSKKSKSKSPSLSPSHRITSGKGRRGDRRSKKPAHGIPYSSDSSEDGDSDAEDSDGQSEFRKRSLPTVLTTPTETFEILNDLVLDRGPSANLSLLELFGDEEHLTTVQADGIVISTPTGSTAYSLAAGGPLTHPDIPAILISPICPHTLSFRPMLLPDSMELRICVPFDSRSTAWASFDGRGRVELKQGDHIKVTASAYPFPTICSSTQSSDWFHSLSRCLRWNERQRQKGFRVVEHSRPRRSRQQSTSMMGAPTTPNAALATPSTGQTNRNSMHGSEFSGSNAEAFQSADNSSQNDSQPSSGKTPSQRRRHINAERQLQQQQQQQHTSGTPISPSTTSLPGYNPLQTNGSSNSVRARAAQSSQPSPAPSQSGGRRNNRYDIQDDYDPSFPHTETMLTCWGTDYHDSDYDDEDDEDDDLVRNGPGGDEDRADEGDAEWEDGFVTSDDSDVEPGSPLVRDGLTVSSSPKVVAAVVAPLAIAACSSIPSTSFETSGSVIDSSVVGVQLPVAAIETMLSRQAPSTHACHSPIISPQSSPPQSAITTGTAAGVGSVARTVGGTTVVSRIAIITSSPPIRDLEDHLRIPKSTSPISDGYISFDEDDRKGASA